jgi:TP901 family phage tail tape measure protein
MTRPLKTALGGSKALAKQLQDTKGQLKALTQAQGHIGAFRQLIAQAKDTGTNLNAARQRLKQLQEQMAAAGPPTEAMARKLKSAEIAVEKLAFAHRKQLGAANDARKALEAGGISTARLGQHERELTGRIDQATQAMRRQEAELAKLNARQAQRRAARAGYERATDIRDRVAGSGATTAAAGTAVGLPMVKIIKDYSRFEDAMLGVARQVDGTRDANGRLTRTYYDMTEAIKAMATQIPMATTELAALVEGGARMGIQGKADLLAFAKTAATAAIAFDLPAESIGESMSKIANLFKVPIKDIGQLGDVINYLDDNAQSKGADIINVMQRIAGVTTQVGMSYRDAAALGSTFLSLGASAEIAATATNAMIRELAIATQQPKRFQKGLKALHLDAKAIQKGMATDATGTIQKVLVAINKLPKDKQIGITTELFGKEYGDDAAKLANNLAEYRRQLTLTRDAKAKGSMAREGSARNDTLSAQWQMTKNRLFNQSSELGQALRPAMMQTMEMVNGVLARVTAWTKANPELAATLVKIATALALFLSVVGGLLLAVAALLGPLAAARFALSSLGISLGAGAGPLSLFAKGLGFLLKSFGLVGQVVLWLGRLLLMNPIGLLITAIAAGAYLIWKHWDGIGPKFAALWQGIKDVAGIAWDWIKGKAIGAGQLLAAFFLNWTLPGLIFKHWDSITAFIGALPGRFTTFGSQIMQGLVNGITSGLANVKAAIVGAGESTIAWFKEKLGIHSPSRVFTALGGFTMAGLTNGITDNQHGPLGAVLAVSKKLTSAGAGIALSAGVAMAGGARIDSRPPLTAQRGAPVVAAAPSTFQITIHAAPGMNEQQLAQAVAREIDRQQRQRQAAGRSRLTDRD